MKTFDAIIIGAGQAGPSLAGRLDAAGMRVAFVERKFFGGTCVNTGCMPTKTLVASARAAYMARRAADFGVVLQGDVGIDMAKVKSRADAIIMGSRTNLETWLGGMKNVTLFRGHGRFSSPSSIAVGEETITAPKIFVNVGGRALVPPLPGVDTIDYLTNTSILTLSKVPEHLVVIGGSYIGLEFAQMYRRFGAKVTVIEKGPRLVAREDPDVSDAIADILRNEDITLRLSAECIAFEKGENGIQVNVDCSSDGRATQASHVLLAVGRRPNTEDLGLDVAGVKTDARGYIEVDDQLRTNVPGIWAMGDCNGRGAFTHTAYNDFEIVAANVLDDDPRKVSDRIPTYGLFIDPPLGRCGLTETEATKLGRPILVGTRPMSRVGRAKEKDEMQGFMKVVIDAETKKILGGMILGTEGDEAIHGILDMMYADVPYTVLQRSVAIHPTVSELIPTMLGDVRLKK